MRIITDWAAAKFDRRVGGAMLLLTMMTMALLRARPQVSSQQKPEVFEDVTAQSGVVFQHCASKTSRKYLPEAMTGGVALFDYDGDGRLDVFFVNGARLSDPMPAGRSADKRDPKYWNRLYRNNGDGTFTDRTQSAGLQGTGYGMGVAVADYDNDGHPDLYVTNMEHNTLYHNNGDGSFTDVSESAGVASSGWSSGAAFVDYDRDGRLDLVVSRYLKWDFASDTWCGGHEPGRRAYCDPTIFPAITHQLFHNEGQGKFRDVTAASGFARYPGKGLGVAINDYDRDGWPDILIANDSAPQQLFHNLRNGQFAETALASGTAFDEDGQAFAGMGADFADYNNDGWPDIFINALANQRYALFRNSEGVFQYASDPEGIGAASRLHSGWGARFLDYDNDGWKDLFVGQGHVMDNIELTQPNLRYREACLLLHNERGRFRDATDEGGAGLKAARTVRGAAFGDWNNDGLVDIAMNCNDGPAVMLENQGKNGKHWLLVDTIGERSNRDGIGAQLHLVTADGREQYAVVSTAGSYLSASDKRVHFGLGANSAARTLEIAWPSGTTQRLSNIAADQLLRVRESR